MTSIPSCGDSQPILTMTLIDTTLLFDIQNIRQAVLCVKENGRQGFHDEPSDLSSINFDCTGTTHIGKYLLNHSFMIPGLIGVGSTTIVGYIIKVFFLRF